MLRARRSANDTLYADPGNGVKSPIISPIN
jgi:hypothetical protein